MRCSVVPLSAPHPTRYCGWVKALCTEPCAGCSCVSKPSLQRPRIVTGVRQRIAAAVARPRPHPFDDRNQLTPAALDKQPAAHFPRARSVRNAKEPRTTIRGFFVPRRSRFGLLVIGPFLGGRAGGRRRRVHSNHRDSNKLRPCSVRPVPPAVPPTFCSASPRAFKRSAIRAVRREVNPVYSSAIACCSS